VIARGNRGQIIFRDDKDYSLYLKFLSEYKSRSRRAKEPGRARELISAAGGLKH